MVTVSLRLDDQMKKELDEMCSEMGMNDPFYSERNMAQIAKAERQVNDGKVIVKSMRELEDMECE